MKLSHSLIAICILAGATFAAYAAVEHARPFAPPTAAELGLSGTYVVQWNDLREQTLSLRDSARGAVRQRIQHLDELLATAAPDLDAFDREAQQATDSYIAQARALKAKKLAFYDSLPAQQQAQVRLVLRNRLERLQQLPAFNAAFGDASP
jgi:hypothetical protein